MRRGLTLIELLLAVALLIGVASAIVPLTRTALVGVQEIDQDLLWRRSADMAFNEIGLVLLRRDRQEKQTGPVFTDEHTLRVRTAAGGAMTFTLTNGQLLVDQDGGPRRVLIGQMEKIELELEEETGHLLIQISSSGGTSVQRSWELGP